MQQLLTQPNATPISEGLIAAILRSTIPAGTPEVDFAFTYYGGYSNDIAEVRLSDGRCLMVKRGRYSWASARFESSRIAADLLRRGTGIVTPRSLAVGPDLDDRPLDVYWRIDLPTLAEIWPQLHRREREGAMRSLGELVRRAHRVRPQGNGDLGGLAVGGASLFRVLAEDIGGRLLTAARHDWPAGVPLLNLLLGMIPCVAGSSTEGGVLLHGDLHMGNVLCAREAGSVRSVGLIDLESAHAGPAESDLARLSIIHSELFQMQIQGPWLEWTLEGYSDRLDPKLFGFYVLYHLAQLGLYSASIGHYQHAENVALAARAAMEAAPEPGVPEGVAAILARSSDRRHEHSEQESQRRRADRGFPSPISTGSPAARQSGNPGPSRRAGMPRADSSATASSEKRQ